MAQEAAGLPPRLEPEEVSQRDAGAAKTDADNTPLKE